MAVERSASSMPSQITSNEPISTDSEERVLCQHCRRTASNGIRCLGMCVADSEY